MKSVYIHIPFCKTICYYCDFCKFIYNKDWVFKYLISLENEIKKRYKGEKIKTIYIGGGTPSYLNNNELIKLFNIINIFDLSELNEFTIESNVEDICDEKLKLYKDNKVNRISIGVQTFNKKFLSEIGRNSSVDIASKINLVKKYFNNINVDLMYGFLNEDIKDLKNDINKILDLSVNHISIYSLIIEKNTRFYNLKPISEDLDYLMFKNIDEKLTSNGFIHYEISNYCKKGYESKHNLTYWNNEEYYGFGLGAASYINNIRYINTKNLILYLNNNFKVEQEILSKEDIINYEFILGFRKIKGINKKYFFDKYKIDIRKINIINELIKQKYLIDDGENVFINKKYLYVENEILINFV